MDIPKGLKFPMEDLDWAKKVLIGGVLNTSLILIFISFGYVLETMKLIMEGESDLPDWEEFGTKLMMGLKGFVIVIAYMIIPIIVMIVFMISGKINLMLMGILVGAILGLVIGYIVPMAIAHYVAKGKIKVAFEFKKIIKMIKPVFKDYTTCYILTVSLFILTMAIYTMPLIGWVVGSILLFYLLLVWAYYFAKLYMKSNQ